MSQAGSNNVSNGPGVVNSVTGTNGVTASPTTGAVVVSGVNATTTTVGVASFNSADFTVNGSGQVTLIGTGGAPIQTITGNTGGAEVPSSGNFNVLGTGSITVAGSANTETVQLTGITNHALQVGAGTATLTQLGAGTTGQVLQTNTTADPTWSTATYPSTTTINQVLYSSANNTVTGLATANDGVLITSNTGVPSLLANGTTGQVLTATTGAPPSWAANSAAGAVLTITGNTGGAESPSANNFNILTANSTVKFAGTAATETVDFGLTNLLLGAPGSSISSATQNCGYGQLSLPALTTGTNNSCYGYGSGDSLTTGQGNSLFGTGAGASITISSLSTAIGVSALGNFTTTAGNIASNTALGYFCFKNALTGHHLIGIGVNAGLNYVGAESSNIVIGNSGTAAESNVIRIGTQGSGSGQQNTCFIAGIVGVTTSNTQAVTIDSTTGQLGVTTFAPTYAYTATAISYQVLITDKIIGVTSNASARTITMPNAGMVAGQSWTIKDQAGTAQSANNITISGNGANIDGASTFVINTNYGSASLYFDGTNFFII